jgi:hypothetical protein
MPSVNNIRNQPKKKQKDDDDDDDDDVDFDLLISLIDKLALNAKQKFKLSSILFCLFVCVLERNKLIINYALKYKYKYIYTSLANILYHFF